MTAIKLHDVLHGFQAGQGKGTAALGANMIQQIMAMREAVLFEVFLDLHNAYDALDWDRFLDILTAYKVVPRTIQLLQTYWGRLTMVDRASIYFGLPFKGYHIVTQGDHLSPTLFNMVVDTVIRNWVMVVVPTVDGLEVHDLSVGELAAYFYADNGIVASNQP